MKYSELRAEKKAYQDKLNGANKIICLQINEISKLNNDIDESIHLVKLKREKNTRLKEAIYLHEKHIESLDNRLNDEKTIGTMYEKYYNKYYDKLMEEYNKSIYYGSLLIVESIVIITLIVLLIKG